jgi:hypothetical protein
MRAAGFLAIVAANRSVHATTSTHTIAHAHLSMSGILIRTHTADIRTEE